MTTPDANIVFDKYEKRGAYHWDWYERNQFQYKDRVHLVLAHLPTAGSVIDIGGGDGLLSYLLFKNGLDVTCVDENAYSIQLAHQNIEQALYGRGLKGHLKRLMATYDLRASRSIQRYRSGKLQLVADSVFNLAPVEPFDYAVCHEVIEHVPNPERLLQFMHHNVSKYAIISTPDITARALHPLDYQGWTPSTFADLLSVYRFEFILNDGYSMYVKLYCSE